MSADFFENQDAAERNTSRLVWLFALAVIAIALTLYALAVVVTGVQGQDPRTGALQVALLWWNPELLSLVALGVLIVVGGGSLYKISQLRAGGKVIAEQLGGRLLHPDTTDRHERILLNVVEEMAIASGTPTPPVYLLPDEQGINAFAAGFSPNDAVVGVTRGAVLALSRDELQGVIAHEFSHILNGDMRLNIRLMGVLHGILIIGIIGYFLLRSAMFSSLGRRSRDNNGMIFLGLGIGLIVIGSLGTFFGNWIKASVSRQREYLADASAVQFTRNPLGIAGALKRIGGFAEGSKLASPNAPEASHLFFGQALRGGLSSIFATHPPLGERIKRLDPSFQGDFESYATTAAEGTAGVAGVAHQARPRRGRVRPGRSLGPEGDVGCELEIRRPDERAAGTGVLERRGQPLVVGVGEIQGLLRLCDGAVSGLGHHRLVLARHREGCVPLTENCVTPGLLAEQVGLGVVAPHLGGGVERR